MTPLICPSILTLPPSIDVLSAVARVNQAQAGFALVTDPHLVGIFTERNLFDAIAAGRELAGLTLADVMTQLPIVLRESEAENLAVILQHFQHYELQYLPVVNDQEQPVGVITCQAVLKALPQIDLHQREALQRSELTNRLLLDANPNLMIRLARDGTYRDFMPAKEFKSFTPVPNIQGKTIFEVMPSAFAQERMHYVELALQTGRMQVHEFELEVEGDRRYQEAQISVSGADEVLIIVRDITERKRAEDALRQREQEFRALAENASDIITRVDRQFRFRYVNPQTERETGIPASAWIGKTELDLGYPESVVLSWHAVLQQVFESGQEYSYEPEFPTVDGMQYWSCRLVPELAADGSVETVLAISRNITERKQMETALWQSTERFNEIVRTISQAFFVRSISSGDFLYVSPAYEKIWGRTCDSLYEDAHSWFEAVHPDDRPLVLQSLQEEQQSDSTTRQYRIIRPDGAVRWVQANVSLVKDAADRPLRLIGTAEDITDRKLAEEKLHESQRFIQNIADASPNVLYLHDLLEHCNVYANHEISQVLGYTPAEVQAMGSSVLQTLMHPDDFIAFGKYAERLLLAEDGDVLEFEYRMRHKNGEWRCLYSRETIFLRTSEGAPQQVLGAATDITDRKQMETALQQSEQRYRAIIEDQTELIARSRADTITTFANEAFCRYFGLRREEVIGKSYQFVIYPEDREHVAQLMNSLSAENPMVTIENRVFAANGEVRWTQWINRVILDEQNQVAEFQCVGRDITDRKQVELSLQESEEKFRQLAAHLQDVFWILSPDNFSTLYVSPAFEKVWGQSCESAYCNSYAFIESIHPDDRERVTNAIVERNRSGEETDLEYRIIRPDGEMRWIHDRGFPIVNEAGEVYRFVGIASDITDRKLSEESLRESEARLRTLIENLPFSCWVCDAEGRHVLQNSVDIQRWGNLLGRTKDALNLPQAVREQWTLAYQRVLAGEVVQGETKYPMDHQLRTFFYILAPVRSDDESSQNVVHGIVGVSIDITDRKQAEEALHQAKEAAEAANRAKSEFLSRMSHELRTPLTSVLGFADLIARDTALSAEHQDHLAIIRRSGTHLLNLINSVLEMSRIEAGELTLSETSFNLHHLLETIGALFQLRAVSKGLILSVSWETDLPQYIQTDENKLRQVLINLLDNAIKFTETGRVTLRVNRGQRTENELLPHPFDSPSGSPSGSSAIVLRFEVEDTGVGIAPEETAILFNAFVQTQAGRKLQQGTGLGLAISRQFIQILGGEITVSSQLGQGTTFCFEIPVHATETTAVSSAAFMSRPVTGLATSTPYRILIVDDQAETRKLLVKLLKPIGFEVEEATNGQEAVALWERWHPHLIWMDMSMPVMNGYRATREIRAREQAGMKRETKQQDGIPETEPLPSTLPSTKIIALTANAFDQQCADALAAGCNDFVAKPFQPSSILEKIAEHLAVQYFYAIDQLEETFHLATPVQPSLAPLALPTTWSTDLRNAALRLNSHQCLRLIEQLPETDRCLAQRLTDWVNRFQFDAIVGWVEQSGD